MNSEEQRGPAVRPRRDAPSAAEPPAAFGVRPPPGHDDSIRHIPSPREFMKARRPRLFSDTEVAKRPVLARSLLEYHLEHITTRKQELEFENFARKLAEKEICPNIRPQTGPVGGGDSKADAETYPVSEELSELWYFGDARGKDGATERWAFAFSAKREWRQKVSDDVKKIVATGRGYATIFFITSRFARDKKRAEVEDGLRGEYGTGVCILDRTWIVEKVFGNRREQLAIETLGIDGVSSEEVRRGPLDTERATELEALEAQIADPERYCGAGYQLAEDSLRAALIARGLERPRAEIDGMFDRATRLAESHGIRQQRLRSAYHRAWTEFWWFEDLRSFSRSYREVERLASGAEAPDVELLHNLWSLFYGAVGAGRLPDDGTLSGRTEALRTELRRLAAERGRPSSALRGRAGLLLVGLMERAADAPRLAEVLSSVREIFAAAKGLVDFPAQRYARLIIELGDQFGEVDGFDDAFEAALAAVAEHEDRLARGQMLLRRGEQKLTAGRRYDAIAFLGRAYLDLATHESRGDMAVALALCGCAYYEASLPWAARACYLLASDLAIKEFGEAGHMSPLGPRCLQELALLELLLGRVPGAMAFAEASRALAAAVEPTAELDARLRERWAAFDICLGGALLCAEPIDLDDLSRLAGALDGLGLPMARAALLYALGYEDRLRSEGFIPADEAREATRAVFGEWREESRQETRTPTLMQRRSVLLSSGVLGCSVTVTAPNRDDSIFLAESLLAATEAFLATSLGSAIVPFRATLEVRIVPRDFLDVPLEAVVISGPGFAVEIRHHSASSGMVGSEEFHRAFLTAVATIAANIAIAPDVEALEGVIGSERGLGRALLFGNVGATVGNILGSRPKLRLADWDGGPLAGSEKFPPRHPVPRFESAPEARAPGSGVSPRPGTGDPPKDLLDAGALKHSEQGVASLVDVALWDRAAWQGTGFAWSLALDDPPVLFPIFRGRQAGQQIFAAWRTELGEDDVEERLRIAIVTGIEIGNPAAYRVVVGLNPGAMPWSGKRRLVVVSRINRMDPLNGDNLDHFLAAYRIAGSYLFAPGTTAEDGTPVFNVSLAVRKKELYLRPAWQIGRNDPDSVGVDGHDRVIVPGDVAAPPVAELQSWKRSREHTREPGATAGGGRTLGRNEPCFCGSGKKFKRCHVR